MYPCYSADTLSQWIFEEAGAYMESTAEYTADGNYLKKVTSSDGKSVSYNYDSVKGNLTSMTEPGSVTTGYTYAASNYLLTKVTQGSRTLATNTYDNLSRVKCVKYNGVERVNYTYDNDGNVSRIDDKFSNVTTTSG